MVGGALVLVHLVCCWYWMMDCLVLYDVAGVVVDIDGSTLMKD